jgi:hypothetical protein
MSLSANVRYRGKGRGNQIVQEPQLATRPGGSHRLPLTSGLRSIAAVRMPTGEGVKPTEAVEKRKNASYDISKTLGFAAVTVEAPVDIGSAA